MCLYSMCLLIYILAEMFNCSYFSAAAKQTRLVLGTRKQSSCPTLTSIYMVRYRHSCPFFASLAVRASYPYLLLFDCQSHSCLWRSRQVRKYVSDEAVHSLVHVFVTSHLDCCNSLCASSSVSTLQRCTGTKLCGKSSCWWITSCIIWYMAELCQVCSNDQLWSALLQDYIVPRMHKCLTDGSFSVAGPSEWTEQLNFIAHLLAALFSTILKRFDFLSFIFSCSSVS